MKKILLLTLPFISLFAYSQQPMNLDACMKYAVENSYKTARAATDLDNAKKEYSGAVLSHLPGVNASMGVGSNFGRGIDPATNNPVTYTTFNNSAQLSASMPIFYGLRYLNQTRSAKIAKLRGEEQLRYTRDQVAEATMLTYAEVVYYTEMVELQQKKIESYQMEEKRMARLLELGGGSAADLAQIRASLASEEYNAIALRNSLEISMVKLKDCMNFPLDDLLKIVPQIEDATLYLEEQTPADIIAFAFNAHPVAIIEQHNLTWQKRSLSMARGAYYPSLSLGGSISSIYYTSSAEKYTPYFTQYKNNLGESVNLNLQIPIFNGLEARLRVSVAKNNLKQAQRDYDETMRTLSSEIRQALMELEASHSQWLQAQKNVEYQQIANQANHRKYETGTLSIIELQTSDNQFFQSEIELRRAYLQYQIKVREMNYYKGKGYLN
ncbi:MAG: TolC family protein [Lentimicrobiaceae bacterium]|nr:TolC family protein [Lentimicrobiaceae bacterium]